LEVIPAGGNPSSYGKNTELDRNSIVSIYTQTYEERLATQSGSCTALHYSIRPFLFPLDFLINPCSSLYFSANRCVFQPENFPNSSVTGKIHSKN